jgi:hypothetical protein
MNRQFEFPLTSSFFSIPHGVEGRLTSEDYIKFIIDSDIIPSNYSVVVESFNGNFKNIGDLKTIVRLPHIHFVKEAFISLIPKVIDPSLPIFIGTMIRGKTYHVSKSSLRHSGYILLS